MKLTETNVHLRQQRASRSREDPADPGNEFAGVGALGLEWNPQIMRRSKERRQDLRSR